MSGHGPPMPGLYAPTVHFAADRTLGCGATLLDALTVGRVEFGIRGPWLETVLLRNPGILGGGRYT